MTQTAHKGTGDYSVEHGTFTVQREFPAPLERVFRAFSDIDQKRVWFAEGEGFTVLEYTLDFKVGGREFARFRFGDGPDMTFDAHYMDIIANRRIVHAYSMTAAGEPFSASLSTTEMEPASAGTRVVYTEQCAFFDGKDGIDARREGTIQIFEALAAFLEGSR